MSDLPQQLVDNQEELAACCAHLSASSAFGFDTEFIGEDTYHPHLCLVQVATAERLYVIDPLAVESLECFWELVADPARVVVVHAGREEIRMCKLGCGRPPGNLFDLQIAAGLVGLGYPMGHGPLVQQLLKVQLAKGETLTDWARRPLTRHQVQYAYDDVRYLLPLWRLLTKRLDKLGRAGWATEEFQALTRRALLENPAVERWRKLRGLGSLDRKRLAVVRELFAWREEVAERQNRPARTVVRDDLVVEIARRLPQKERDLTVLRGLPRQDHDAILAAVRRGREVPPDDWPTLQERDNDPPQIGLVNSLLMAVLGDLCARSSLTPGIVATSNDIKLLVRARFQKAALPVESALTHGWRSEAILPALLAVLDGRQGVRIANVRAAAPFALTGESPAPDRPAEPDAPA
jgi:ribonuclease D